MLAVITVTVVTLMGVSLGQSPEVSVGQIDFPELIWGKQALEFEIVNNTDWLKFLTVTTEVSFEGSFVNPNREERKHYILEPQATLKCDPQIDIPGNYGTATLWVRIFDVVDTLDDLSLGRQIFEQPLMMKFRAPEETIPYFQERLSVTPMLGNDYLMDNEFSRLFMLLVDEGKSLDEIAKITGANMDFVTRIRDGLASAKYIKKQGDSLSTVVAVITNVEAKKGRKLAEKLSDQLVEKVNENMEGYNLVIDSLIKAGAMSGDSTNFYEGSTVLFQLYPMITGMYLWYGLGTVFVAGRADFYIFDQTNPCRPHLGDYAYIVHGGDFYNGTQYYDSRPTSKGINIHFGDKVPTVTCDPGYHRKVRLIEGRDWNYDEEFAPESFFFDAELMDPPIRALANGALEIIGVASQDLQSIIEEHGHTNFSRGVRLWFWNLTATLATDKLVKSGFMEQLGNGQYKFIRKVKTGH